MIVYSFIIPHKNCPNLLERLLETIPEREDTEVIIVDDHSDMVDFNHFPGSNRKNTKCVFLEKSEGAGNARNIGMDNAKGKWYLFADSDDYYTDAINGILNKYSKEELIDLVILNARAVDEMGNTYPLRMNLYVNNYIKKRPYSEKVIRYELWTPWSRMVKASFVKDNNLRFENIPVGNDVKFGLECSRFAGKMAVETPIVYNYYLPQGRSVTNKNRKNLSSLERRVDATFWHLDFCKEVNYIFKPNHILHRWKVETDVDKEYKKEYLKIYNAVLKKHHYSNITDFWYFLVFAIGRLFKIV